MAELKRKISDDIDIDEGRKTLHFELIAELTGHLYPGEASYERTLILAGAYLSPKEISQCKDNVKEFFDILEKKGKFGIGNYDVIRNMLVGENEPAVEIIKKYEKEIDNLSLPNVKSLKLTDRNYTELTLKENIEKAKTLSVVAKKLLSEIKLTDCIDEAEGIESELREVVGKWKAVIEKTVSLEEELQRTSQKDGIPIVSEDLDFEYLHSTEKRGHEHNIRALINMASKEIKLKKEEISPGLLTSWNKDDEIFSPTKATEYIYKEAQTKHKILLDGSPGSGKSANVHHIALRLKDKGYKLFCMRSVNEMVEMIDKLGEDKQVYVFDDVFGVHGVVEEKRKGWGDENKDNLERCMRKANVIILCTSRSTVIKDDQLSNIKSRFTIINISHGKNELSDDERVEIFRRHAAAKQRDDLLKDENQLTDKVKDKIKNITCPVGCFPLVCRLYTGDKEIKQTMEEYFNKPLKVIADNLANLRTEEPIRHFCLLLCLIYDNKLPVNTIEVAYESEQDEQTKLLRQQLLGICELEPSPSLQTIKNKMDTLLETFVKLEGSHYIFVHDIIHDAVIKHVNGLPSSVHKVIMRHCSSKFMRYRVHLSGVVCKGGWLGGHDTVSCINIRSDSITCWGFRVLDIVRDGVRTSDQLYNDIDEGRCSIDDRRVRCDNPWVDVFEYNPCVHSTEGQTAIVQALESSDVQTIMCTKGYSWYGGPRVTGLHWAIEQGLTHIVTQTMSMLSPTQLREVVSIHDEGLLCRAIRLGCGTDVIQALIVGGADVNTPDVNGDTPLCSAIDEGCGTDVIQALIVGGADVNTPDVNGDTPLCSAIDEGCGTDVIQALIVGGADVNTPYVFGDSPLHESVWRGDYKITQLLVDNGADVNQCDEDGRSVLYESQLLGYDTITELLQSGGAVCKYKGKQYNHVMDIPDLRLFNFVLCNNYQAVKILIERGDDVNQCDKYGTSALYLSQLEGRDTITELLQSHGAVCIYKGKRYTTITDIPDSEVYGWERRKIQELKEKQKVTK